jgi:hypothetical protein
MEVKQQVPQYTSDSSDEEVQDYNKDTHQNAIVQHFLKTIYASISLVWLFV